MIRDFKDLIVWRKAIGFAKEVYRISSLFPKEEKYGLTAQVRRAAISVSSNIAEGHSRQGHEFHHFLSIARGSLAEVESQMLLAVELSLIHDSELGSLFGLISEIRRMTSSLMQKLP